MNRYAVLVRILALAVLAVSVGGAPVSEENESLADAISHTSIKDEVQQLEQQGMETFGEFCVASHNFILDDLKKHSSALSSVIFKLFFNSTQAVSELKDAPRQEVNSQPAANPDELVIDAAQGNGGVIEASSRANSMLVAFKIVFSAISRTIGEMVNEQLQQLKAVSTPQNLVLGLSAGCGLVVSYEEQLRGQLEKYKQDKLSAEVREKFASTDLASIPCPTIANVIRTKGLCDLVKTACKPVEKILAINQTPIQS